MQAQKAKDIFAAVRALVEDDAGDYATDDVLVPLLQLAIERMENAMLDNPNIGKYKTTVEIPSVPALTTSLQDYFAPGKSLEMLVDPISVMEKQAGLPAYNYVPMTPQLDAPNTLVQGGFNGFYSFKGTDILLPGATLVTDIRIFGTFAPQPITGPDSPVPPGCAAYLKLSLAAIVSRAHGNKDLATDYNTDAANQLFLMVNNIIMEMQLSPSRSQSFSGEGTNGPQ